MNIYVGNLAYTTGDDDLLRLFSQYGKVASARVIMDRITGKSKGFGFVEMPNQSEAEAALQGANGQDFMGRSLRVNESQPRPEGERGAPRGGGGDRGGDRGGGRDRGSRSSY